MAGSGEKKSFTTACVALNNYSWVLVGVKTCIEVGGASFNGGDGFDSSRIVDAMSVLDAHFYIERSLY